MVQGARDGAGGESAPPLSTNPARVENPLWWPSAAAPAPAEPRNGRGSGLAKSAKLPQPGAALKHDSASLYAFSTLTAASGESAFELPGIRSLSKQSAADKPRQPNKLHSLHRTQPTSKPPSSNASPRRRAPPFPTSGDGSLPVALPGIRARRDSSRISLPGSANPAAHCSTPYSAASAAVGALGPAIGSPPGHADPDDADYELIRDVRTSDDVVEFYAKYGQDSPVPFFFCRAGPPALEFRPYDLAVVRREAAGDDYYTISATGVMHMRKGLKAEFKPLAEWKRERTLFRLVSNISFFKHYLKRKALTFWHQHKQRAAFQRVRARIASRLFFAKPLFVAALSDIAAATHRLASVDLVHTAPHTYHSLDEYAEVQQRQREVRAKAEIDSVFDEVELRAQRLCKAVQKEARVYQESVRSAAELNDLSGVDLFQGRAGGKDRSMVAIKQEKIDRADTYRRIMQEEQLLENFVRLVDYMCSEAVMARAVDGVRAVLDQLRFSRDLPPDKLAKATFVTLVSFLDDGMRFSPPATAVRDVIHSNVIDGMLAAVHAAPRILYMRAFAQYFLGKPSGLNIRNIVCSAPEFVALVRAVDDTLTEDYAAADEYVAVFENVRMVHQHGQTWDVEAYRASVAATANVRKVKRDLRQYKEWRADLDRMKISQVVGCLMVDSKTLKSALVPVVQRTQEDIQGVLAEMARERCRAVLEDLSARNELLLDKPEELDAFMEYQSAHALQMKERAQVLRDAERVDEMYETLALYGQKVDAKDAIKHDDLQAAVADFAAVLGSGKEFIVDQGEAQQAALAAGAAELKAECDDLAAALRTGMYVDNESDVLDVVEDLEGRLLRMAELKDTCESYKRYQAVFGIEEDPFLEVEAADKELTNRHAVWATFHDVTGHAYDWTQNPLLNENNSASMTIEGIRQTLEEFTVKAFQLKKQNKGDSIVADLCDAIDDVKELMPLFEEMTNPALKPRHWIEVLETVSALEAYCPVEVMRRRRVEEAAAAGTKPELSDLEMEFKPFNINKLLKLRIMDHLEAVQAISLRASKEYSLEKALEKMEADWSGVQFVVIAYKDTGTYIVGGMDEIQALLDDQIVKIQSMRASPFIKQLEARATRWHMLLNTLQDMVDNWLSCQATWQYLEPIFSSPDIMKQMPDESNKFQQVDSQWREVMESAKESPDCLTVAADTENLAMLQENNQLLDVIQKGLAAYLEVKRIAFPRFFFLSNDEMLEILSETKDPTRVQPHLKKCFEGIASLAFAPNADITAMVSAEGETVPFATPVLPRKANGAVEKWLVQVEAAMIASLHGVCAQGVEAYATTPRIQWVSEWPGQIVLVVTAIFWTRQVAAAIESGEAGALKRVAEDNTADLNAIVGKVRGQLSSLERATLSALVVMDVHARDVAVRLAEEGIEGCPNHFSWLAQLRMYWENTDPDDPAQRGIPIRMMNAAATYGYEYLGNSSRLVVTPLTDRCYRTLIGAIHMNLGGAPEGPAGTGKTETTKDLAKALARQCVVFNCSDTLDYLTMAKFFKGLAASGAWACFDEFNRIDLEVLSVVAQQVLEIQIAVKNRVKTFIFEGSELPLKPTCNAFITMNPGYAGRSELPDNLKALFRTVAMMVPDYALISEIILYSNGYLQARECARKIVATYKLCSEQLSSQDHYDYGMRAVMAVLRAAGNLKRQYPNEDELVLMLRSIIDVNLCKFLSHDVPLFEAIVSDLFPGVSLPAPDYAHLERALRARCRGSNLQATEYFLRKTIQLYEMIVVRHGLMTVGQPFSGKSSALRMLAGALTDLAEEGVPGALFSRVTLRVINPKAVTMGRLYGEADRATQEWRDGVLGFTFRQLAADPSPDRKWCVLDGPVDAIWIENMNTVLDDNKKLCLPNSEIIAMSPTMSMIFEVGDLAVASPATVSRCGMVYLEPHQLGWEPLLSSWLTTLPEGLGTDMISLTERLFKWMMPACLRFVRREVAEQSPTEDVALANNTMRLMGSLLDEFQPEGAPAGGAAAPARSVMDAAEKIKWVEALFVFSLVWAVGATGGAADRRKFDTFFRELTSGMTPQGYEQEVPHGHVRLNTPMMPADGSSVFDWLFNKQRSEWQRWAGLVPAPAIAADAQFAEIIVPTVDSTRYTYLLDLAVQHQLPILLVGPTGTGKSVYVQNHLVQGLSASEWAPIFVTFSARTSAAMTQEQIDGRLDKRKRGVYGPPVGKRAVVFVDDLNMPAKETFGAQPPVELLRQCLDHGGWYGADNSFRSLTDVQFVAAMGPPGGGRTSVTNRYLRHFITLALTPPDDKTLSTIFRTILDWHFSTGCFPAAVTQLAEPLISGTLDVYQRSMDTLLPTPAKSHYIFNLRDFARVISGVMLLPAAVLGDDPQRTVRRLWVHEILRVFCDRLTDASDQEWLLATAKEATQKHFGADLDNLMGHVNGGAATTLEHMRRVFFGDYMDDNAEPAARNYGEAPDAAAVIGRMEASLEDHNGMSKRPMNLAMFLFAAEHVSRICRLLRQPGGHALLVGLGGSGRQSLTRLASFMCGMNVFQVEISKSYGAAEWREDLKAMLQKAGRDMQPCVFLFSDTQIKHEAFVEDINNVLNSGEVPGMFAGEEKAAILEAVRPAAARRGLESPAELWGFFVEQCRQKLHVVFCMSPIGGAFRERLRANPSLVNCCTIDWFHPWPRDALQAVAAKFLEQMDLKAEQRLVVSDVCQQMHKLVRDRSHDFLSDLGRHNYVTPTSYLELIGLFQSLLAAQRAENRTLHSRYVVGLQKLEGSAAAVAGMQQELQALQPQLVKTVGEVEVLMAQIAAEKRDVVEPKAEVVKVEEAKAQEKADAAKAIKDECEADLAVAMPILNEALAALDTIKEADVSYIKKLGNPPAAIKLVMEAVCVTLQVKPVKAKDEAGKPVDDYWKPSVALLNEKDFLSRLKQYDKDNISPKVIEAIRKKYTSDPAFTPENAKKASSAAEGMCKWVHAMDKYESVAKVVAPKQAKLAEAEASYEEVMVGLRALQEELKGLMDKLAAMERELEENTEKKNRLEAEVELCSVKLERAEKLIGGLGGEKSRWTATADSLEAAHNHLTGDTLLSAGIIAYLGAFTSSFRTSIVDDFVAMLGKTRLRFSQNFSMGTMLGKPVKIREWLIAGLPNDAFSIENAIMVANARRWPLCIDPQGQANKWIKNMEKDNNLQVIKLSGGGDYMRVLENAIQFGLPVLLENVGEELDPTLEPLLLKQIFKQGGVYCMRLGDNTIEFSNDFRFYITTKLRNPHYLPEIAVKLTLLNFMITPAGLADQLLGVVVATERPDLEEQRNTLVVQSAENTRKLKEIEDRILEVLSSSEGNILEDESAIGIITEAKATANDIAEKQKLAEVTEQEIEAARVGYKPCSAYTSILFFCISDLAALDPMYQYSLPWFINLFVASTTLAEPSADVAQRLDNIEHHFTYALYCNVCRSLFEKDKLLFAFLLSVRIRESRGELDAAEWLFLLTGGLGAPPAAPNPAPQWLLGRAWRELCKLAALPAFAGLDAAVETDPAAWRVLHDAAAPHAAPLPAPFGGLDSFRRLLVTRCVRPDRVTPAVQAFVEAEMGRRFVEPPPFRLDACYADSSPTTPLIFVLSAGSDPTASLLQFAAEKGMDRRLQAISLGQGQGPKAAALIAEGAIAGSWVVLQNCHLAPSWMPSLDKICEDLNPDDTHPDFRLWMTSYPSPAFPTGVLQNGVKMTNEPPKGLRANMARTFTLEPLASDDFFEGSNKPRDFKRLVFALGFFHAVIQERRRFGPLGWNIPYGFDDGDWRISVRQLLMFVNEGDSVPFDAIQYVTGECNYGGRVTDDKDRRLLNTLLEQCYSPELLSDEPYQLSASGLYKCDWAADTTRDQMVEFLTTLPAVPAPEAFGLHANADIAKDENDTASLFASLLRTGGGGGGGGAGAAADVDRRVAEVVAECSARLPAPFDIEAASRKYPVLYEQSMNTVLVQEMSRFNRLIAVMADSLKSIDLAIRGLLVMSSELEAAYLSISINKVPALWAKASYPSLKPLGSYLEDLYKRLQMLQDWYDNGMPPNFWLSGFFFVQSFLTAGLQNYARKRKIPIDMVTYEHEMLSPDPAAYSSPPADGVYVHGLFLEGCGWDSDRGVLCESQPKVLYVSAPCMYLRPVECSREVERPHYKAPVYRTAERRGVLATTGHSTNFIMFIKMPSELPEQHWTARGVALLSQLSD